MYTFISTISSDAKIVLHYIYSSTSQPSKLSKKKKMQKKLSSQSNLGKHLGKYLSKEIQCNKKNYSKKTKKRPGLNAAFELPYFLLECCFKEFQ